ncbi:MAG: TatD family hydrolase [Candidatus Paceibacterota bacterium]|jgi:TatD DNase family protein
MLFDSHTHLNLAAFDLDRDVIIKKYLKEGIFLVNIGTCFQTSKKAIEITEIYKNCWASVGLHPAHTFPAPLDQLDKNEINSPNSDVQETLIVEEFDSKFENLIFHNTKVIAIGECGLDYSYLKDLSLEKQDEFKIMQEKEFRRQIKIAQKYDLPLILHLRNLYKEALHILKENNYLGKAVFHFFTGSLEDLKLILQNPNYSISFSGVITYGNKLDEVIESTPLERILIETDAPYVSPVPYRGQRNEPNHVIEVAKKISKIKKLPLEEVEKATFENTKRLFNLSF